MKNVLLLLLGFLFVLSGNTNNPVSTVPVTLNVDTKVISESNINQACSFEGQDPSVPITDFLTEVARGDIVVWEGVSATAPETDVVQVTLIKREVGTDLFGKSRLRDNSQNPGVVVGSVLRGAPGDEQKYSLTFKVFNNGQLRGTFKIDPKLRVKN